MFVAADKKSFRACEVFFNLLKDIYIYIYNVCVCVCVRERERDQIRVVALFKARTIFARSNVGAMGSNRNGSIDHCASLNVTRRLKRQWPSDLKGQREEEE
jgi:hypothetical protein